MIRSSARALVFLVVLAASAVTAQPVILEVQVVDASGDPNGTPELAVIYGTGFGDPPLVYLGTQMTTLVVAADQSLCASPPSPPPLDPSGIDCVVTELPDPIPCGDYLVSLEGDLPLAGCEDGDPAVLVFRYTGQACDPNQDNTQEGRFQCSGDPAGAEPVQVICDDGDCSYRLARRAPKASRGRLARTARMPVLARA